MLADSVIHRMHIRYFQCHTVILICKRCTRSYRTQLVNDVAPDLTISHSSMNHVISANTKFCNFLTKTAVAYKCQTTVHRQPLQSRFPSPVNLYCVGGHVKPCMLNQSVSHV